MSNSYEALLAHAAALNESAYFRDVVLELRPDLRRIPGGQPDMMIHPNDQMFLFSMERWRDVNVALSQYYNNEFAHSINPLEFEHAEVATMCLKLKLRTDDKPANLRERYMIYLRKVDT